MSLQIEKALEDCISRVAAGQGSAEDCAASYPQHADELLSLVHLATEIRSLPRPAPPAGGLVYVQQRVRRAAKARHSAARTRIIPWPRRPVWRLVWTTAVVLVAVALSMGSVTVAAESLPGNPLYPVKRAVEQVQLRVTFDSQRRVALRLALAERRANEIIALAHRGQPVDEITLAVMLEETGIAIQQLQNLSPDAARTLLSRAQDILDYQQICLVHIRPDAPKAALAAIDQAIQICQQRADLIRQMEQELNPDTQNQ